MAYRSLLRNRNMANGSSGTARAVHQGHCSEYKLSVIGNWNRRDLVAAHTCSLPTQTAWIAIPADQAEYRQLEAYRCPECGQNFVTGGAASPIFGTKRLSRRLPGLSPVN